MIPIPQPAMSPVISLPPGAVARPSIPAEPLPKLAGEALLAEVERRAFLFFWQKADEHTGLVHDRASNFGKDSYVVASVAATGYGLAAIPAGIEHGWINREEGARRARQTLAFLVHDLPNTHGWLYHFVDSRTGARAWRCEVSSIDTALLVAGALTCGQYFPGTDIEALSNRLYDRLDWTWMRTQGGARPDSQLLCHGWTPEKGFLPYDWDTYSDGMLLYLLGLGARRNPLPPTAWTAWRRDVVSYGGEQTLTGGPIFLHQIGQGFFDLRNRRDTLGYDYWVSSASATRMQRQFCIDRAGRGRPGYGSDGWGLNAGDGPRGYKAYAGPGGPGDREDGTLSPTGAIASVIFEPKLAISAANAVYARYGARLWGRFGFANSYNAGRDWYDEDVIGIDLGMALVSIEDHRSGLYWHLLGSHPSVTRACGAAGLHLTSEPEPRPLRVPAPPL